jgi:dephospho-CoA kinase
MGQMRAGKDTVCELLQEEQHFFKLAFGTEIKNIVHTYFPDAVKQGKPRHHYQYVGQLFRELDPLVWIKQVDKCINSLWDDVPLIVTDCRQPNEFGYLKSRGFIMVKVVANEDIRISRMIRNGDNVSQEDMTDETELHIKDFVADFTIVNNGTVEELREQVLKLLEI